MSEHDERAAELLTGFLVRKGEAAAAKRRAEAEKGERAARDRLTETLPNGTIVWPDGRGTKPTTEELDERGLW